MAVKHPWRVSESIWRRGIELKIREAAELQARSDGIQRQIHNAIGDRSAIREKIRVIEETELAPASRRIDVLVSEKRDVERQLKEVRQQLRGQHFQPDDLTRDPRLRGILG